VPPALLRQGVTSTLLLQLLLIASGLPHILLFKQLHLLPLQLASIIRSSRNFTVRATLPLSGLRLPL
jgi:hypothetical protein